MTTPNNLAKHIPARWFSLCAAALACTLMQSASPDLKPLVRAYRAEPTEAHRLAVETFATAHANDSEGVLARLALGVVAYERQDYPAAIATLKTVQGKLPQIGDYSAYYLAAARVESDDFNGIAAGLRPTHSADTRSPLSGKAWLLEGRAEGVRALLAHEAELPQPDGDLTLADCYRTAGDLAKAAVFYQRVFDQYPTGDAATKAATALRTLKDAMGDAFPPPLPQQMLRRADRLMELRSYAQARAEYDSLPGDRALVGVGAADFLDGKAASAIVYLSGLTVAEPEADAERLYYIEECARQINQNDLMLSAVARLGSQYPQSPWRLKALVSAANRYLLVNRPDDYLPLYKAAYEDFPSDPAAGLYHWKVAFHAYFAGESGAAELLREHLRHYARHATASAALYFLGRQAEGANDFAAARAFYQRLSETFPNQYYAMLARDRLRQPEVERAGPSADAASFLAGLQFPQAKPIPTASTLATNVRIERSRLLRAAGLADLADAELRFGARTDAQPAIAAMEIAATADAPYLGVKVMKALSPDYLNLPIGNAPRPYWEFLFPIPYRDELVADAGANNLDPYLFAGLIRQESEFNPDAISRATAYGLSQVRAVTARPFARAAGIPRFTAPMLLQPATNLKMGTAIFRSMLDQNGGSVEQTLAAYNAGPNRAAEWIGWHSYREPAEFVESIPFTETREYVQAVLRNAEIYRRLYR